jgi:serine kinase of HPr protein (carbohydrate metabolism regulator)
MTMTVKEIVKNLNLTVLSGDNFLNKEVTGAYSSDLLSDVMGNAEDGNLWITLQVHKNIIAVAVLKELAGIILVKGLKPDAETLELSQKEGIALLSTTGSALPDSYIN